MLRHQINKLRGNILRMKKIIQSISIVVMVLSMAHMSQALAAKKEKKDNWIAKVNGKSITQSQVVRYRDYLRENGSPPESLDLQKLAISMITEEALLQEANKKKISNSKSFRYELALAKRKLIITKLLKEYLGKNQPTSAEIDSAYREYSKDKIEYEVRHILLDDPAKAKEIVKKIRKGDSFTQLAKEHSLDSSASNGGRLGWVTPGVFVPEFKEALLKLDEDEWTRTPVKSSFGWHIIQNLGERKRTILPYSEVKQKLINSINQSKVNEYSQILVKKANIEVPPTPKKKK